MNEIPSLVTFDFVSQAFGIPKFKLELIVQQTTDFPKAFTTCDGIDVFARPEIWAWFNRHFDMIQKELR